jgi:ABC-type lipopolysaccharide export system ATPase subunit
LFENNRGLVSASSTHLTASLIMSNLITCKAVSKAFGAQNLFENISFTVAAGEKIGIIGPNGSGKSTLLKIICGLEEADGGQVVLRKFLRLSYLAQDDLFNDQETVFANLLAAAVDLDLDDGAKANRVRTLLSRAEFSDPELAVADVWRFVGRCSMTLTFWSSMNPPTILTSRVFSGLKACWPPPLPIFWSATTAISWKIAAPE